MKANFDLTFFDFALICDSQLNGGSHYRHWYIP